jgi:hypothetical protein
MHFIKVDASCRRNNADLVVFFEVRWCYHFINSRYWLFAVRFYVEFQIYFIFFLLLSCWNVDNCLGRPDKRTVINISTRDKPNFLYSSISSHP